MDVKDNDPFAKFKRWIIDKPGRAVAWWMMGAYSYEKQNDTLIPDVLWDWLGRFIRDNRRKCEQHPHCFLIKKGAEQTAYYIRRYPKMVIGAVMSLRKSGGFQKWLEKISRRTDSNL